MKETLFGFDPIFLGWVGGLGVLALIRWLWTWLLGKQSSRDATGSEPRQ
jgi:hypothetical protein